MTDPGTSTKGSRGVGRSLLGGLDAIKAGRRPIRRCRRSRPQSTARVGPGAQGDAIFLREGGGITGSRYRTQARAELIRSCRESVGVPSCRRVLTSTELSFPRKSWGLCRRQHRPETLRQATRHISDVRYAAIAAVWSRELGIHTPIRLVAHVLICNLLCEWEGDRFRGIYTYLHLFSWDGKKSAGTA
jgi:hypothetical protein